MRACRPQIAGGNRLRGIAQQVRHGRNIRIFLQEASPVNERGNDFTDRTKRHVQFSFTEAVSGNRDREPYRGGAQRVRAAAPSRQISGACAPWDGRLPQEAAPIARCIRDINGLPCAGLVQPFHHWPDRPKRRHPAFQQEAGTSCQRQQPSRHHRQPEQEPEPEAPPFPDLAFIGGQRRQGHFIHLFKEAGQSALPIINVIAAPSLCNGPAIHFAA